MGTLLSWWGLMARSSGGPTTAALPSTPCTCRYPISSPTSARDSKEDHRNHGGASAHAGTLQVLHAGEGLTRPAITSVRAIGNNARSDCARGARARHARWGASPAGDLPRRGTFLV